MLELEDNIKELESLKAKLKEIGESLWHWKRKRRTFKIRKRNTRSKFLEW